VEVNGDCHYLHAQYRELAEKDQEGGYLRSPLHLTAPGKHKKRERVIESGRVIASIETWIVGQFGGKGQVGQLLLRDE